MHLRHFSLALAAICLPLLSTAPAARAADGYVGYAFRTASASSNWSDRWGWNWANGYTGGGSAVTEWSGQGGHTASVPIAAYNTQPVSLSFWSDPAGGDGGETYSGGEFSIPGPTAWPAVAQFNFHLYSVLGENNGAFATSRSTVAGNFYTEAVSTPQAPLYYRIEWQMATSGNAGFSASVMIGTGENTFQLSPGSGSVVGVMGADFYAWGANGLIRPFDLNTSVYEDGAARDPGRVDLWATLYLSNSPIPAVPEPGSGWMLAVGLAGLVGVHLRRRRGTDTSLTTPR